MAEKLAVEETQLDFALNCLNPYIVNRKQFYALSSLLECSCLWNQYVCVV